MKLFLTILKTRINKQALLLIAICFIVTVQGCIAALPLAYPIYAAASYAMGGFVAYKYIQTTTGGEVEVRFKDSKSSVENQEALSSLERLADLSGEPEGRQTGRGFGKERSIRYYHPLFGAKSVTGYSYSC